MPDDIQPIQPDQTAAPSSVAPDFPAPSAESETSAPLQVSVVSDPSPASAPAPSEEVRPSQTPEPPAPPAAAPRFSIRDLLAKASAVIHAHKAAKLEKIIHAVVQHGHTSNDGVEKLLHVSDATATRYLEILVKDGRLKRVGATGHAVRYEKP